MNNKLNCHNKYVLAIYVSSIYCLHFTAIAGKETVFAGSFMEAIFRTLMMATGELEYTSQFYGDQTKVEDFPSEEAKQWEIYCGRIIFIGFVFLFVIVLLNLLNAIAIEDVSVKHPRPQPLVTN